MRPQVLISMPPKGGDGYIRAVCQAGGAAIPLYCPPLDTPADALVLGGGGDIHPDLLGEPDRGSREIDLPRDRAELALVARFIREGKPIFGICRGHQVVHVALGGSLIQDLPPALTPIHEPPEGAGEDRHHPLITAPGSRLERLLGPLPLVNSWHHQGVDRPGRGLVTTGWTRDGVLEASEHQTLPILTVQFHPERMAGQGLADGVALFRQMIAWCEGV